MLKIYNVKQGDSFLLKPRNNCSFDDYPLLIDCGTSQQNVYKRIPHDQIDVLITHSHKDHMGGLSKVLHHKNVRNLYIPYFLPEVIEVIKYLDKQALGRFIKFDWSDITGCNLKVIGDGGHVCPNHTQVFNPPKNAAAHFDDSISDISLGQAVEGLVSYGIEVSEDWIESYQSPVAELVRDVDQIYNNEARTYVRNFFVSLFSYLNNHPVEAVEYYLTQHVKSLANKSSIVFRYNHQSSESILFTGDADIPVFERMIDSGYNFSATILKIPHHGSANNIDTAILKEIAPKVAIISHDNGKFGTSIKSHPHSSVITLLSRLNIDTHYTNDVIKNTVKIVNASYGLHYKNLLDFV